MEEKLYENVSFAGVVGMIMGILVIITGVINITAGIMTLVQAVRLRSSRKMITF